MRWESGRRSTNVEDRRGMGGGAIVGGGGIGMLILVLIISFISGREPSRTASADRCGRSSRRISADGSPVGG